LTLPESIRPAVLIPTFNNCRTLAGVVERALARVPAVLVVDDGSSDSTAETLRAFGDRIQVHRHPRNLGKGRALRTGFEKLQAAGFTHAIALDSDGQHYPEDLPRFLEAIERSPRAIVIGQRDMGGSGAPRRSRFGLWFSNGALRYLSGVRLKDTQCGFRAYPLSGVGELGLRGERYDLELEVLLLAAKAGIPIEPVPVEATYSPDGGRVTHFRPVRDFLQIAGRVARILSGQS
jgi:glycosyltransferase involved in cell wall biosynthesis